ncbi:hypothetical protein Hanom_Chr04g00310771 [Helianthus anomalus]
MVNKDVLTDGQQVNLLEDVNNIERVIFDDNASHRRCSDEFMLLFISSL